MHRKALILRMNLRHWKFAGILKVMGVGIRAIWSQKLKRIPIQKMEHTVLSWKFVIQAD